MLKKLRICKDIFSFSCTHAMEKVYISACHRYVLYTTKCLNYIALYILIKSCRGKLSKLSDFKSIPLIIEPSRSGEKDLSGLMLSSFMENQRFLPSI